MRGERKYKEEGGANDGSPVAEDSGRRQEVAQISFVHVKMRRNEGMRSGEHRGVRMFA